MHVTQLSTHTHTLTNDAGLPMNTHNTLTQAQTSTHPLPSFDGILQTVSVGVSQLQFKENY